MEEYIITVQNNSNSSTHIDVLKEELEEMCKIYENKHQTVKSERFMGGKKVQDPQVQKV